jgi:hypothetical protein
MEKKVGINQRISINVMEMAMKAALDGCFTPEYAADLASGEYQGENRINKARSIIGKLTLRNPLFPFIEEHKQEYFTAIKYKGDRAIIFTALINAAYTFGYDALAILGKFFHVQEEVSSQLIINRFRPYMPAIVLYPMLYIASCPCTLKRDCLAAHKPVYILKMTLR